MDRRQSRAAHVLGFACASVLTSLGFADTYEWKGAASGDFATANLWKNVTTSTDPAAAAPTTGDSIIFDSSSASVSLSANHTVNELGVFNNALSLQLNGKTFTATSATAVDEYYSAFAGTRVAPSLGLSSASAGGQFTTGHFDLGPGSTLSVGSNVRLSTNTAALGYVDAANNTTRTAVATISGANAWWRVTDDLIVGATGNASLNISSGGNVYVDSDLTLGSQTGVSGSALVNAGSYLSAQNLYVGRDGDGSIIVTDGSIGASNYPKIYVGTGAGNGSISVSGASAVVNAYRVDVGANGQFSFQNGTASSVYETNVLAGGELSISGGKWTTGWLGVGGDLQFTGGELVSSGTSIGSAGGAFEVGDGAGAAAVLRLGGYNTASEHQFNGGLHLRSDSQTLVTRNLVTTNLQVDSGAAFTLGDAAVNQLYDAKASLKVDSISGDGSITWLNGKLRTTNYSWDGAGPLNNSTGTGSTLDLQAGRSIENTGMLTLSGGGIAIAEGGRLTTDGISASSGPGVIFNGGNLTVKTGVLSVGSTGAMRQDVSLGDQAAILAQGGLALDDRNLTVDGGLLIMSSLSSTGNGGQLRFASGSINHTGSEGLTLGGDGIKDANGGDAIQMGEKSSIAVGTSDVNGSIRVAAGTTVTLSSSSATYYWDRPSLAVTGGTLTLDPGARVIVDGGRVDVAALAGDAVEFAKGHLSVDGNGVTTSIGGNIVGHSGGNATNLVEVIDGSSLVIGKYNTNTGDLEIAQGYGVQINGGAVVVYGNVVGPGNLTIINGGDLYVSGSVTLRADTGTNLLDVGMGVEAGAVTISGANFTVDSGSFVAATLTKSGNGDLTYVRGRLHLGESFTLGDTVKTPAAELQITDGSQLGSDGILTIGAGKTLKLTNSGRLKVDGLVKAPANGATPAGQFIWEAGTLEITSENGVGITMGGMLGDNLTVGEESAKPTRYSELLVENLSVGALNGESTDAGTLTILKGGRVSVGNTLNLYNHGLINIGDGGRLVAQYYHKYGGSLNISGGGQFIVTANLPPVTDDLDIDSHFRAPEVPIGNGGRVNVNLNGILETAVKIDPGGRLAGRGKVVGSIFNKGVIAPGASPGTLTLDGTYEQGAAGIFELEIGRNSGGLISDLLTINGTATLDGRLAVLIDTSSAGMLGYSPSAGDRFTFLSATDIIGEFSGHTLPILSSGLHWYLISGSEVGTGRETLALAVEGGNFLGGTLIPEPSALTLLAGLSGAGLLRRRRRA